QTRTDHVREGRRHAGDGSDRAACHARRDERLAPDEYGQAEVEVRLDAVERRLADLQSGEVVDLGTDAADGRDRQRVARARREGVAPEREWRGGPGGGDEVGDD